MRVFTGVAIFVVAITAILTAGICYSNYINRFKEHVYTTQEIAAQACVKRGGNPVSNVGWKNEIYVEDYKCEGVQ